MSLDCILQIPRVMTSVKRFLLLSTNCLQNNYPFKEGYESSQIEAYLLD